MKRGPIHVRLPVIARQLHADGITVNVPTLAKAMNVCRKTVRRALGHAFESGQDLPPIVDYLHRPCKTRDTTASLPKEMTVEEIWKRAAQIREENCRQKGAKPTREWDRLEHRLPYQRRSSNGD